MSKYYKAEAVIRAIEEMQNCDNGYSDTYDKAQIIGVLEELPIIEVEEDCISREHLKSFAYINKGDFNSVETIREWIDNAPSVVPKTQIKAQNSNENSNGISVSDGVSEMIRCAMCNNPNQSYKGCDGACSYDEKLYKRIMDAINASSVVPKRSCYRCGLREDCEDSTERKPKEGEWADIFDILIGRGRCPDCGAKMKGADDE